MINLFKHGKGFDKPISVAGTLLLTIIVLFLVVTLVSGVMDSGVNQLTSISESVYVP